MREALQQLIDDVLNPLLQKDESRVELVTCEEDEVVVRVSGRAAFGAGAEYVRTGVIEPAIRKVAGEACTVRVKKSVPTVKRRE